MNRKIEAGCLAVITQCLLDPSVPGTVVTVISRREGKGFTDQPNIWMIDKEVPWKDIQTGGTNYHPYIPEMYLLRIDGGEPEKTMEKEDELART